MRPLCDEKKKSFKPNTMRLWLLSVGLRFNGRDNDMETIEYINPKCDRSKWPAGEWDGEPDKKQWQDKATGLPCLANRQPRTGHWCGYVGVPKSHPLYGKEYDKADVDVHWGLTFSDKCQEVV